MDKQIKKIQKGVVKSERELEKLARADKRQDKIVEKAKKMKGRC